MIRAGIYTRIKPQCGQLVSFGRFSSGLQYNSSCKPESFGEAVFAQIKGGCLGLLKYRRLVVIEPPRILAFLGFTFGRAIIERILVLLIF